MCQFTQSLLNTTKMFFFFLVNVKNSTDFVQEKLNQRHFRLFDNVMQMFLKVIRIVFVAPDTNNMTKLIIFEYLLFI